MEQETTGASDHTVVIRRTEPDDARGFAAVLAGPRAVWGTMQLPYPSAVEWRKRLESNPDTLFSLVACVDDADGEVVGSIALIGQDHPRQRHVASLGMAVRDDWHGRGVGTKLLAAVLDMADNWVQVTRVELQVYPDNQAAVRLYRAAGFEEEGLSRGAVFRDGEYVDVMHMARLHPDLAART